MRILWLLGGEQSRGEVGVGVRGPQGLRRKQLRAQGVSEPGGEEWAGSGGILPLKPPGFPDGCNTDCKTERIVKNDRNVLNLSNCKKGAATDQDGEGGGGESGVLAGRTAGAGCGLPMGGNERSSLVGCREAYMRCWCHVVSRGDSAAWDTSLLVT